MRIVRSMVTVAAALFASVVGMAQVAPAYRVVGYYPDWTAARYPLATVPGDKLTHVNYAFGKVGPDARLTFGAAAALETVYPDDCTEAGCAHGLFNQIAKFKQRFPRVKFLMSVGGWTGSGPFYAMAASDETRRRFADSCAAFLQTYPQFDGIDIDWEHPVAGGLQPGRPEDAGNYVRLLADLRRAIGANKLLTVAVGAGPRAIAPLDYAAMVTSLDFVNLMTYDFHAGGGSRVGHNAPLYDNKDPQDPNLNTHAAVEALLAKGVPASQLVVGVPFYGRGWTGVASAAPWSAATGTGQAGAYNVIVDRFLNQPGYVRGWDDVAKVPYLYNAKAGHWITYEDPESARLKGEYVANRKLGGAMFWELSNDNGQLLDALRQGLGLQ